MNVKSTLLLTLLLPPSWLLGQSIEPMLVATCGDVFGSSNAVLEWSAGEAVVAGYSQPAVALTQGFHQPNLIITAIANSQPVLMQVWPNPVADALHLKADAPGAAPFRVDLYNQLGQCLIHRDWTETAAECTVSVAQLSAGSYTLVVSSDAMTKPATWKIVKLND